MIETPQQAARRLSGPALEKGFKPEALYTYRNADGSESYHKIRARHPDSREKWIRPMHKNGSGYQFGEPPFPNGKPLYRLQELVAKPGNPCWYVEGENCADALAELGVLATTAGSASSDEKADYSPLAKRAVVVWPDNDTAGMEHGRRVAEKLRAIGCSVEVIDAGVLGLPDGGDCVNWLEERPFAEAKDLAKLPRAREERRSRFADVRTVTDGPDWSPPEALPELPAVPPFNFEVLPGVLRAFVQDIAERMQCPPEFPAVGAVAMIGAAIGRRLGIRPKRYDSWTVVPNLWGMIVGKSGIMKSPAQADAIAPLKRMQAKAFEEYEQAKSEYEISAKAEKIRAAHAEGEARKALQKDRGANLKAMLLPDVAVEEPKPRRYVVNDSTPEALCETLKDNPHGVLCERDELIGLLRSMDKEGQQEARALYLTAADGDKSFTVDRILRGSARHIQGVCVSIVGGIQPGVLAGYVRETQRGLAGDDGLLQRFGLMVYPDIARGWQNVDRPENRDAKSAVYGLVERLCNLTPEQVGAEPAPEGGIPYLRFSNAAQALFVEWLADLEGKIRSGEDHPAIVSHLAKYRKVVPALALINHLCEGGTGPVTDRALSLALLFITLLEAHARRVYSYASRPDLDAAKTVLAKLKAGKLPIEFTARLVYRQGWSGLTGPDETTAALRVLVDYGYLRERVEQGEAGGRSSTVYRAHPSTKEGAL